MGPIHLAPVLAQAIFGLKGNLNPKSQGKSDGVRVLTGGPWKEPARWTNTTRSLGMGPINLASVVAEAIFGLKGTLNPKSQGKSHGVRVLTGGPWKEPAR